MASERLDRLAALGGSAPAAAEHASATTTLAAMNTRERVMDPLLGGHKRAPPL
jgi:hypothetical protein